jgi:ParB family chromosome partitioning protein
MARRLRAQLAQGDPGPVDAQTTAPVYEIIAGERRFRAARLAGLDSVPVLVRDVGNEAAAAMALIENMQREDLNPLEEAQGLQRLVRSSGSRTSRRRRRSAVRAAPPATCCAC